MHGLESILAEDSVCWDHFERALEAMLARR